MLTSKSAIGNPQEIISLAQTLGSLKKLKRTGWVNYSVSLPESVADHSYGVGLLALFLARYFDIDADKAVRMALIHDLGEAVVGDIVTQHGDKVLDNESEKLRIEREALSRMLKDAGREDYMELFDEYLEGQTPEAQFVHQLDKLEMAFQARLYEQDQGILLDEFMTNAKKHITDDSLKTILFAILERRA